jgi:threonine synthase
MAESTAAGQRCLYCGESYPLYPPLTAGCLACVTEDFKAPLEVTYRYPDEVDWLTELAPLPGLERYAPLLPPLADRLGLGEGGTPIVRIPDESLPDNLELYVKDESRNPTWSHKDRLNRVVASAALAMESPGVVAASSGNHGASAAAYAARAGLPAVILCTPRPPAVASFMQAFGQLVVAVPDVETRWTLMRRLAEELNYHPVSNQTIPPTNHPFGSEGYKSIAYELFLQLDGRTPQAVFLPVGFAELAFGVYKGFAELHRFGLVDFLPRVIACEPAAGAPLKRALEQGQDLATVEVANSDAYAIAVPINSYRGIVAIRETNGIALAITEDEMRAAQAALARQGIWAELSSTAAYAGALRAGELGMDPEAPVVCVNTSSGFKDIHVGEQPVPETDGSWQALMEKMEAHRFA